MAASAEEVLAEVGERLRESPRKDAVVKLLKKAASALSELRQSSALKCAITPLSDSLVQHSLIQHKDKDVKLLLAACFSEIIRILAPNPPFSDEILKDVFKLIVSTFTALSDVENAYFSRRVKILETVAALKCCVLMLDIGCEDLILEMFNTFFSVIRDDHHQNLVQAMLSIMSSILEEKVSKCLLELILSNLLKKRKGSSASFRLAVSLLQNCAEKLEPHVRGFLTSSILERDATRNDLKDSYHEIIFEIFHHAPQMLIAVIPNLAQELLTDQVDVRIKALNLIGKLLHQSKLRVAQDYRTLFLEFLNRFSDKSAEVRVSAVECAKTCYLADSSRPEVLELLTAVRGRLLDFDDKVRIQAINVVCELAILDMEHFPSDVMLQAADRLRDKKVSVRKMAMVKLLGLYRAYCIKCSEGVLPLTDHFEQIPCRILTLCFDKDCKEFSLQKMEIMLAEDLFPASLSARERTRHWIALFTFFSVPQQRALNSILIQKQRFQREMRAYLALRTKEKENHSSETNEKILVSLKRMASSFVDSIKAGECFQKLNQMKDNNIFKALSGLVDEHAFSISSCIQDNFLKRIGDRHPNYDFFRVLSLRCGHFIFTADHVCNILKDLLAKKNDEEQYIETSTFDLLFTVLSINPMLLRGSEDHFMDLYSVEVKQINKKLLQMLVRVSGHISLDVSKVYPFLERVCLEGTRAQSKLAISAINSLVTASEQLKFYELSEKLVRLLCNGQNVPTVLQSLGCLAQYSLPAFQLHEEQITQLIIGRLADCFKLYSSDEKTTFHGSTIGSSSDLCKIQIYGLKTLVKGCLPHQGHVRSKNEVLFNTLFKILQDGEASPGVFSSEIDKAHLRLAAAKSIVHLSTRWDLHISPQTFHLAMMLAKDGSPHICRSLLDKINKLLKERSIPKRYACAFALAFSGPFPDLQDDSLKYLMEFFMEYNQEASICHDSSVHDKNAGSMTAFPAYIIVFLIHILAHDQDFPSGNCRDEETYAKFCSPLMVLLQASINPELYNSNQFDINEIVSYTFGIFRAIKRAVDAVDANFTYRLHCLSDIALFAMKRLVPNVKLPSHAPQLVLLPSSFYQVGHEAKTREASHSKSFIDEDFVDRILAVQSLAALPSLVNDEKIGKSRDHLVRVDVKKSNERKLQLVEQAATLENKNKREKMGVIGNCRRSEEMPLHKSDSDSTAKEIASSTAEMIYGRSQILRNKEKIPQDNCFEKMNLPSSCGSALTDPSSDSQVLIIEEKEFRNYKLPVANDKKIVGCTVLRNHVESISSASKICRETKNARDKDKNEMLVGCRISLWSRVNKCFNFGIINEYDSNTGAHKVIFDNGNMEIFHLLNEKWEITYSAPNEDTRKLRIADRRIENDADTSTDDCNMSETVTVETRKENINKQMTTSAGREIYGLRKRLKPSPTDPRT